jgi:hypothetical protein
MNGRLPLSGIGREIAWMSKGSSRLASSIARNARTSRPVASRPLSAPV